MGYGLVHCGICETGLLDVNTAKLCTTFLEKEMKYRSCLASILFTGSDPHLNIRHNRFMRLWHEGYDTISFRNHFIAHHFTVITFAKQAVN